MPVILSIQEAEIRRIADQLKPVQANSSKDSILKIPNIHTQKGLVEWLKWQVSTY
jgi:hypothetical protein